MARHEPSISCIISLAVATFIPAFDTNAASTLTVSNVAASGCSDAGSGTPLRPFCSIQAGIDRAKAGDLVLVLGGVYGPGQVNIAASGTATAPITIRAQPPRAALIDGPPGVGEAAGQGVLITGSHIVFEGFEVRGAAGTGIRNWGSYVTIRNNYVHDNARLCDPKIIAKCGQGIASNGSAPRAGVVIERNLAVRNGSSSSEDHDFYISNPGAIIRNNVAAGASGFGFQIYPNCDGCLVYNNVAYGNARNSGFLIGGDGASNFSSGVRVYNNISAGNSGFGFWIYRNNSEPIIMRNNIAFENSAGTIHLLNSGAPDNKNLLLADPLLVDPAHLDFHLKPGSPAIDAGDAALTPPDDLDGEKRVIGVGVDIGADEFAVAPPPEVATDLSFRNQRSMAWSTSAMTTSYSVYRGLFPGGFWTFNHICLEPALSIPAASDTVIPPAAMAFYYLVSGSNSAGEGILGRISSGQLRPVPFKCR